jgi:4-amino-4-deoxy-L-arabinose transferase-like glycosyltransferase
MEEVDTFKQNISWSIKTLFTEFYNMVKSKMARFIEVTKYSKVILISILIVAAFLRLWGLSSVPVSLFSDELDIGYQAYSMIETGKDYSGNSLPLHFQSYADNRTPLYIYTTIPFVAIFGITPMGVRLPAAIFGILGIWAFYLLVKELLRQRGTTQKITQNRAEIIALLSAFTMAVSPWHIQYSRAAFEVTQLLFFLILGLYFFLKSFRKQKYLWLSIFCFALTPWIYSSAKLFTPLLLIFLFLIWRKEILKMSKKVILSSLLVLVVLGLPMLYVMISGGGGTRFSYISVFTDPTAGTQSEYGKLTDVQFQGNQRNVVSKATSRVIHNELTFWSGKVIDNYLETFSTNFLFIKGDINLRHSIEGVGQFYKVEAIALIFGIIAFFVFFKDRKIKGLILFWILVGVIPSAITRGGGTHATRLILILPPLLFLIAYGLVEGFGLIGKGFKKWAILLYFVFWIINFGFYMHNYWVHNPWYSERSWHAGFEGMVSDVKQMEGSYEKIIITNAIEAPEIFFASYYPYPPDLWQQGFKEEYIDGFGKLKGIGKYYFGQVNVEGFEVLPEVMDDSTLYVSARREIGKNLVMDPQYTPVGLRLVNTVLYPSGEPAFYFFEKGD